MCHVCLFFLDKDFLLLLWASCLYVAALAGIHQRKNTPLVIATKLEAAAAQPPGRMKGDNPQRILIPAAVGSHRMAELRKPGCLLL